MEITWGWIPFLGCSPQSRLREPLHVVRLSNTLCMLRSHGALGALRGEQWVQVGWHTPPGTGTDVSELLAAAAVSGGG